MWWWHGRLSPLADAAKQGDAQRVEQLLIQGNDIHHRNSVTMLVAAEYGHVDVLNVMFQFCYVHEIDPWACDGDHVIISAANKGQLEVVKLLLDHGADIHVARDKTLFNALGYPDIVRLLLDRGADIHAIDGCGKSVLCYANQYESLETIDILNDHLAGKMTCIYYFVLSLCNALIGDMNLLPIVLRYVTAAEGLDRILGLLEQMTLGQKKTESSFLHTKRCF